MALIPRGIVSDCGRLVYKKLIGKKITSVERSKLKGAWIGLTGNQVTLSRRKYSNPAANA